MPRSVCVEPGCSGFAEERGRCATHRKQYIEQARRRTVGRAFYNSKRWRSARKQTLRRDRYTCQECKRFGNEVDHIVPIVQGGKEYALSNLQTLCKSCHSRKTAKETWT